MFAQYRCTNLLVFLSLHINSKIYEQKIYIIDQLQKQEDNNNMHYIYKTYFN